MSEREQFEKEYPAPQWAINATGEAGKAIHYAHLRKEWEGFQKGWQAAIQAERERCAELVRTQAVRFSPFGVRAEFCYELADAIRRG